MVHSIGYVAMVDVIDYASVTNDDELLLSGGSTSLTKREF